MKPAYGIADEHGNLLTKNADRMGMMSDQLANAKLWGTSRGAANKLARLKDLETNPGWAWHKEAKPSRWTVVTIVPSIKK